MDSAPPGLASDSEEADADIAPRSLAPAAVDRLLNKEQAQQLPQEIQKVGGPLSIFIFPTGKRRKE